MQTCIQWEYFKNCSVLILIQENKKTFDVFETRDWNLTEDNKTERTITDLIKVHLTYHIYIYVILLRLLICIRRLRYQ